MDLKKFNIGLVLLLFLTSTLCFGDSKIKELVDKEEFTQISQLLNSASTIADEANLPDNPKTNELIVVENEYDVKILYEFFDDQWNEIGSKEVAKLLQGDTKSTFHHMFNYKVDAKEFNPYVSDEFKVTTANQEDRSIKVKLLSVDFDEKTINESVSKYMAENEIPSDDIINIQILNIQENKNCTLIISHKY